MTREPSGTLREAAAELVERLLPVPTDEENARALETAVRELNRYGITSFIDARVSEPEWRAYRVLDRAGRLSARVVTSLTYGLWSDHAGAEFDAVLARRAEYASARVRTDSVKIFLDGVLEGDTAALLEPYIGRGAFTGELAIEAPPLAEAVARFDALGLQIHLQIGRAHV